MPQSFTCLHYHLIFSTKYRHPWITPEIEPRLHEYMGGIIRRQGGQLIVVGGMTDHVHALASLSKQVTIADTLRDIKANSSAWIHRTYSQLSTFAWQVGYAAFTVSYSGLDDVAKYIANQAEHHRTKTFQEEFIEFLKRHNLAYDERYLWE
jgi:REP element-mobilizing transposase RayT